MLHCSNQVTFLMPVLNRNRGIIGSTNMVIAGHGMLRTPQRESIMHLFVIRPMWQTQHCVLKAEFQAIEPLSYVAGVNYWVGPGTNTSGGYTHIFAQSGQGWFLRPAANELSFFYKTKVPTSGQ